MIKINLLPKTLSQKAVVRNIAIAFAAALVLLIGIGVGVSIKMQGDVEDREALASATETIETRVKGIQAQTASLNESMKPIQAKLDFIRGVLEYNLQFPKLYEEVARWTYEKVVLTGIESNGVEVNLRARVKTLDDLGRYLLNMYRATSLFSEVRVTQASGFDQGSSAGQPPPMTMGTEIAGSQANLAGIGAISGSMARAPQAQGSWIDFTIACKLRNPIVPPTFSGGAAPAGPGAPGAPGPPGTFGGPEPMTGAPREQYAPDIERQQAGGQ